MVDLNLKEINEKMYRKNEILKKQRQLQEKL
jgi:hypothetical protein